MKRVLVGLVLVVAVALIAGGLWLRSLNHYAMPETLQLSILDGPVTVHRDAMGVPYVFAESEADLIRVQGFVVTQDRLFQLEFYRALINGRLAEVIGQAGLESDLRIRLLGLVDNALRHSRALDPGPRTYLERYVAGMNAYLECCEEDFPFELGLLGLEPAPWTVEELMSVMHYVSSEQSRNWRDELMVARLVTALGPERAGDLLPLHRNPERAQPYHWLETEGLGGLATEASSEAAELRDVAGLSAEDLAGLSSRQEPARFPAFGSNNWAVGPSRTASGQALLANDPHLDARLLPGPWYPIGLFAGDIRAFGLALPAVPGLLVGRTEHVAWGVTNGYGDSQDLFIEQVDAQNPERYLDGGEWKDFDVRTEVIRIKDGDGYREQPMRIRSTLRGPLVTDHAIGEVGDGGGATGLHLSFRWTLAEKQRGQIGIDRFLTARSVDDFEAAVADVDILYFNFAIADRHGTIARRSSGRVPTRAPGVGAYPATLGDEPPWQGWIDKEEMPTSRGDGVGWVATANNDLRPDDYPYFFSSHFAPDYRYQRIAQMLDGSPDGTAEQHWDFIQDDVNLQAQKLAPLFADALAGVPELADLTEILRTWDHRDDQESVAPSVYHAIYEQLFGLVFDDELGEALGVDLHENRYFWLQRFDRMLLEGASPWFDDVTTPAIEELDDLIQQAGRRARAVLVERLGHDPKRWFWGELHQVVFVSPLRMSGFGSEQLGLPPVPVSGSGETVLRSQYRAREDFAPSFMDSARFVADFGNDQYVLGVIAGGVVARQGHPAFKNQVPTWASGGYLRWWIDPERARTETSQAVRLEPR